MYSETGVNYAATLVDVASIYNEYGYFRRSREYVDEAKKVLAPTKPARNICRH